MNPSAFFIVINESYLIKHTIKILHIILMILKERKSNEYKQYTSNNRMKSFFTKLSTA